MKAEDAFYIGYITKTRGLKGEVQVYFEFNEYEQLELETVYIDIDSKLIPFFVDSYKLQSNQTGYVFFEDVDHIDAAQKLVKKSLYLPNTQKPERDPDEFLYTDLIGYTVHDTKLGELGSISEVNEYPQQFIAVMPYKFRQVMFPLNEAILLEINEEEGTVLVELPEGLIEIYTGYDSE